EAQSMPDFHTHQGEPPRSGSLFSDVQGPPVICPRCYRSTDSLKCAHVPNVVFLFVYIVWNYERIAACPACMRGFLVKRCLIAIPLTNILFPLFGLMYLFQFLATFGGGHSDAAVADAHRVNRADLMANRPEVLTVQRTPRKEWVILAIVLLLCASV